MESEDFTLDHCPDCGGVFLDPGELNDLIVSTEGDVEYLSDPGADAEGSSRSCPRCDDQEMARARIFDLLDPEVETCPGCHGWFFDAGEVSVANELLRRYSRIDTADDEFRGRIDGKLVRLDRIIDVGVFGATAFGQFAGPKAFALLTISVFFPEPLGLDLHVMAEDWTHWLSKMVGLFKGNDEKTGDAGLDRRILVDRSSEAGLAVLRSPEVASYLREELPKARLLGKRMRWAILDDRVLGWSVPAGTDEHYDPEFDPEGCVAVLRELAARLEKAART